MYSPKRPENLSLIGLGLSLVYVLFTWVLGVFWAHSYSIEAACVPIGVAAVFCLVAWWEARLRRFEMDESRDHERLRREYDRNDLFDDKDEAMELAHEARRSFARYFVPGFTLVFGAVLIAAACGLAWRWHVTLMADTERDALGAGGLCFFMFVFTLLSGSYFNGVSRETNLRFLRPAASWLLLSAAVYLIAGATMLVEHFEGGVWDRGGGHLILVLLGIFGVEMAINFIIEFFRPRSKDEEIRPLYESRLLALVTEPGGIAKNVAHALDYQFGFKVSETWFYRFMEQSVLPCFLLLLVALYLLDCFTYVETHEMGIKERFGRPVAAGTVLGPGLHLKFPRPFERIRRFPVKRVQKVNIGFSEEEGAAPAPPTPGMEDIQGDPTRRVIVWDKTHYKSELKFMVADRSERPERKDDGERDGMRSENVAVSFLSASIPVYYTIKPDGVYDFAYNYDDPTDVLEKIAHRECVRFFASADFIAILGRSRLATKETLADNIRKAIAGMDKPLGIEVVFVGIMGIHPSVEAAPAFQDVVGAVEEKQKIIRDAEREAAETRNAALGRSARIRMQAEAEAFNKSHVAGARAERFREQLVAFRKTPDLYTTRARLDLWLTEAKYKRKFINLIDGRVIWEVNLEQKGRLDLLDLDTEAKEF